MPGQVVEINGVEILPILDNGDFKNSCCNFNLDFLCLDDVASVTRFRSVAGVGSCVRILSKLFIGKKLLLKLSKTFSLTLNNNPKLFKRDCYQVPLYLL